ncbi:MAG: hypothetical protein Q9191_003854 [Dirinaria sp. TL-2023a]
MDVKERLEGLAQLIQENAQILGEYLTESGKRSRKDDESLSPLEELVPRGAPDEILRARRSLLESSWELQWLCAAPGNLLAQHRINYQQLACLRWLIHFKILHHIPLTEDGASWETVASSAKVAVSRLKSVALMTATMNFLRVVPPDNVAHSRISAQFLYHPQYFDWAEFATTYSAPIAHAFSEATQRWGDTSSTSETAFNVAFDTDSSFFDYLASSSDRTGLFARYMRSRNESEELRPDHVLTAFDFDKLGEANIVEVGGSTGQVAILLLKQYPKLHYTVQDLPGTIADASKICSALDPEVSSRLSFVAYDFFKPQPTDVAARTDIFFLRRILHDWPKAEACIILQHLTTALIKPGARILIMDQLMPAPGTEPPLREAIMRATDLTMAQNLNSREREMEDWIQLFENTTPKLKLKGYKLPVGSAMGLMEVVRANEKD